MPERRENGKAGDGASRGYHMGGVDVVLSVDAVEREAGRIAAEAPTADALLALAGIDPFVEIAGLRAGYGKMEILHDFSLAVGRGQSLCLIGPNGAGKSTVLHSIFGFTNIFAGSIRVGGADVTRLPSSLAETSAIASTACSNASSLAFEGFVKPLILRTY